MVSLKREREETFCECGEIMEIYTPGLMASDLDAGQCFEITAVVDGSGRCRVLNETLECGRGDLFLFGRGIPHGFFSENGDAPLRVVSVGFEPRFFEDSEKSGEESLLADRLFKVGVPYSRAVLNSEALCEIASLCRLLKKELCGKALDWRGAVGAYLKILLITVARYIDLADTVQASEKKEWSPAFAAANEVQKHYSDPSLTLGTVAEALYVSPSWLSREFFKIMGESFPDYLRGVRMREACFLLENSELNNDEIAERCGLRDIAGFYHAFKKHMGVTPHMYRKEHDARRRKEARPDGTNLCADISVSVQTGRAGEIKALIGRAIDGGISAERILEDGLICGMAALGERFKRNEVFVPEVLVSARTMNAGLEVLRPLLCMEGIPYKGRVCLGTVQGDLHDIGKNLVRMMMEGKGIEVIDLGVDVAPECFVKTAIERNCGIICCSALLTTTMSVLGDVVRAAEAAGIRDQVKIMVGGAPVNEEFCQKIGADVYTDDAASAADAAVAIFEQYKLNKDD